MRGVENIIRMRLNGKKPTAVVVEMFPVKNWAKCLTEKPGTFVDIHLDPKDITSIDRADLRCVVNCMVIVNGPDEEKTERVARACKKAGARTVIGCFFDIERPDPQMLVKALYLTEEGERTVWPQ